MDTNIIAFKTLLATQDSARWVMWGAIATGIAALGSIVTMICAIGALSTWKNQEKTKIRSEFKRSLLTLDYAIHMMPDSWNSNLVKGLQIRASNAWLSAEDNQIIALYMEVKKCWHDSTSAWVMCEGLLKKTPLTKKWGELSEVYLKFIKGEVDKSSILRKLNEMHSLEFIFD